MLKMKLQYFGHLKRRVDSLEKTLMWEGLGAGGEGDNRGWDGWMTLPTQCTWVWVNSRSWWWSGRPGVLRFMGLQRVGHDWATELNRIQENRTENRSWQSTGPGSNGESICKMGLINSFHLGLMVCHGIHPSLEYYCMSSAICPHLVAMLWGYVPISAPVYKKGSERGK